MELFQDAHHELVEAVARANKTGCTAIPITVVSVSETPMGQCVLFDETKFGKSEVVKRLRLAADFLETLIPKREWDDARDGHF